ncbi:hypothetical protein TNCV_3254461 [Trichonephila clavipes]|nr:hypothetical protein TNCV_3254461 [Trichonephila clavipes]
MEIPLRTAYSQAGRCGMQPKAKHKSSRAGAAKTRSETCEIVEEKQKLLDIREKGERERGNAMANAFCVSVRNNISKRWNNTENDVSKNQSSADSAIRLPNTSILNSNAADITE